MKFSGGFAQVLRVLATLAFIGSSGLLDSAAKAELTSLRIVDYATMPKTGSTGAEGDPVEFVNDAYLARVNFLTEEPREVESEISNRFFVNDLYGPLYILDRTTKQFTTYLDFNGRDGRPGLYNELVFEQNFATGLITVQFDPDYRNNGKFYTVHMEQPSAVPGTSGPMVANHPHPLTFLNVDGNAGTTSTPIATPGGTSRQTILTQWTDTNIENNTFEGTAREMMRVNMPGAIHPMGDIIFNPTAGEADPDWRIMYIAVGDGSAGESGNEDTRRTPQLLNSVNGKILRIAPDNVGLNTPVTSANGGRYYIPNDNPFFNVPNPGGTNGNVRDEIWTLGHRNVHRLAWDVDPANPDEQTNNTLLVNEIGLHKWEEVNIVKKGANYGYSLREGPQELISNNVSGPPPNPDTIAKYLFCTGSSFDDCANNSPENVTPTYPVVAYGHTFGLTHSGVIGDSISSGYVYRGSKIPQLYGKYLFGEITTGQMFYADFEEMLEADDGNPATMAEIHALNILWDDPNAPGGEELYTTTATIGNNTVIGPMFKIVQAGYAARGGTDANLPGNADVTNGGRADIRIQIDEDGELYILSKSDGMIRQIIGPPRIAGDYDHDGDVDAADYSVWRESFGDPVPVDGLWADGNEDGMVDLADYVVWRNAFNGAAAGAALTNVPEPASGLLILVAMCFFSTAQRRRVTCLRREAAWA